MKKYFFTLSFILLVACVGFSQNTTKTISTVKEDKQLVNELLVNSSEKKAQVSSNDEGTNDPLLNGYTKVILNGKEVYQKKAQVSSDIEGTNDPLLNGYTKVIIDGKEVYQKKEGNMTLIYEPKK